jgi:3-phenylpropionate/trans-cinnamate dioxygenase ferredoxin subunit
VGQSLHVGKVAQLQDGEMTVFTVGGRQIAVARIGSAIYALADECTHSACELSEGVIEDGCVLCPCHGSEFDLATGEALSLPATEPVECFKVRVDGDDFYVSL